MNGSRKAYTLFELILVLAVLVIVGALSVPFAESMFGTTKMTAASDAVRACWCEARSRAMEEGRPYKFAVRENSGEYQIAPDSPEFWGEGSNRSAGSDQPANIREGRLDGDIHFCGADASTVAEAGGGSGGQGWLNAGTFNPDGTAQQDVALSFGRPGQRPVVLKLRSSTGAFAAD